MSISDATVKTLTAEVRVMIVGSRQITRSVFRQLDIVPWNYIEAMGRVNEGAYRDEWVVGRHTETGALVRSNWAEERDTELSETFEKLHLIVLAGLK